MREFRTSRDVPDFANMDLIAEEYLDIYLFHELVEAGKAEKDISVKGYNEFHIYSSTVEAYNRYFEEFKCECTNEVDHFLLTHLSVFAEFRRQLYKGWYPKPIVWDERKHNAYYVQKLEASFTFELFVYLSFYKRKVDLKPFWEREGQDSGENELGVEIKFDMESANTQNFYIEYAEKNDASNQEYVDSGILKTDNTKLIFIGTKDENVILKKNELVQVFNIQKEKRQRTGQTDPGFFFVQKPTSLGLLIRKDIAGRMSLSIDEAVELLLNK